MVRPGHAGSPRLPQSAAAWTRHAGQLFPLSQNLPQNIGLQPLSEALGPEGARLHRPIPGAASEPLTASELAARVREAGLALGFARVGFTKIDPFELGEDRLRSWLEAGHHAQMSYLTAAPRHEPAQLLAEAKTLIAVALPYANANVVALRASHSGSPLTGVIARYARGNDYHDVMRGKLRRLADAVANLIGRPVLARHCVDSAPLLERAAAERAGIGFAAKSTMTIVPGVGSFVMLGELLLDVPIATDAPMPQRCGSCRLCLDACPTGAFVEAHVLDARRCISYWTIEHTGVIPREFRHLIGARVFGCDVCQDVCPFNASSTPRAAAPEMAARPELVAPDLVMLLELGSARYRSLVKGTALRRTHRAQLSRNAAIALGNSRDLRAVPPLVRALAAHRSSLVRGHAAWALGELGSGAAPLGGEALRCAHEHDSAAFVREEAEFALSRLAASGEAR
jgi:epoxyqueuosine reductase